MASSEYRLPETSLSLSEGRACSGRDNLEPVISRSSSNLRSKTTRFGSSYDSPGLEYQMERWPTQRWQEDIWIVSAKLPAEWENPLEVDSNEAFHGFRDVCRPPLLESAFAHEVLER